MKSQYIFRKKYKRAVASGKNPRLRQPCFCVRSEMVYHVRRQRSVEDGLSRKATAFGRRSSISRGVRLFEPLGRGIARLFFIEQRKILGIVESRQKGKFLDFVISAFKKFFGVVHSHIV